MNANSKKIRVGLFGFGRAGRAVAEELLADEKIDLVWVAQRTAQDKLYASDLLGVSKNEGLLLAVDGYEADDLFNTNPVDFVLDFSSEKTIFYYGKAAVKHGIGIISAVSHYGPKQLSFLKGLSEKTKVLYSPNITLGINFLMVAAQALKKMAPQADVEIIEQHFRGKSETSGTALRMAEVLGLDVNTQINSVRVGGIVGKHEVIFGFPFQTIRLVHESISRNAFGQGSLYAVKRMMRKTNGFYTMEQLIKEEFKGAV